MAIIRCVFWQRDVFFQRFAKLFFQGTHRNHPSVFKVPVWKKLRCEGWSPRPRWRAAESDDIVVPGARKSKLAGPGSGGEMWASSNIPTHLLGGGFNYSLFSIPYFRK